MTKTHFIERQKLYFEFTSEERAKQWNKQTTTFYREEILPILEKIFDRYVPSDQWYSIPRLEIDLGNIYSRDIKDVLLKKIEAELCSLLERKKVPHALSENVGNALDPTNDVEVKSPNQKLLEIFYSFLKNGVLPWNSQINSTEFLEQEIRQNIGAVHLAALPEFHELVSVQIVRERLFYQFSKPFREEIFRSLFSKEIKVLLTFRNFISKNLELSTLDGEGKRKIKTILSSDITSWIVLERSNQPETWPEAIVFSMFQKMIESQKRKDQILDFIRMVTLLDESKPKFGSDNATMQLLKRYAIAFIASQTLGKPSVKSAKILSNEVDPIENQKIGSNGGSTQEPIDNDVSQANIRKSVNFSTPKNTDETRSMKTSQDIASDAADSLTPLSENKKQDSLSKKREASRSKDNTSKSKELPQPQAEESVSLELKKPNIDPFKTQLNNVLQEYFILNAGIILCWPYLTRLFEVAGYLVDKKFKDQKRQERAIHLLGYLAGFEQCDEHQLTLAKLLTNWPLSKPVIKRLKLTSKEKKAANEMLSYMILNWPILKDTSIEGLQKSFFNRDGKLKKGEQGWKLIVEQKSYDMLLDHLAYSIAIIKLPWMEEVLRVDWA